MNETIIKIEALSFKQALKYLLLKESHRHAKDILNIREDLEKLKDVELPELPLDIWIEP